MPGGGIRPRGPSTRAAARRLCPRAHPTPHHCPGLDDCSGPPGPPASSLPSAQLHHNTVRLGSPWGAALSRTQLGIHAQLDIAGSSSPTSMCPVAWGHRLIRHTGSPPSTCLAVSTAWATPSSHSPGPLAGSVAQPPRPSQAFRGQAPGALGLKSGPLVPALGSLQSRGVLTLASQEVRCG